MLVLAHNSMLNYHEGFANCVKHIHLLEELIFVRQGECTVITDRFTRRLSGSFVIFTPRRIAHEQINEPGVPYSRWMLIFDKTTQLHGVMLNDEPFVLELTENLSDRLNTMFISLSELFERCESVSDSDKNRYDQTRRDLLISMIVNELCELLGSKPIDSDLIKDGGISAICDYIDANFEKRIGLDELAARFFISRTKLTRTFRRKTGMSVGEYITATRISRSKQLLIEERQLEEVAHMCGFQCANYYIKVFEKVCGVTPTYFRTYFAPDYINEKGMVCDKAARKKDAE